MKFLAVLLYLSISITTTLNAQEPLRQQLKREVAITIDDLPVASTISLSDDEYLQLTNQLVSSISRLEIPAYGFVIGNKLPTQGLDKLKIWLDAGLKLGNHTFSHPDLNVLDADEFNGNIVAGEGGVKKLLADRNLELNYFRFPMLHRGNSAEKKRKVASFLEEKSYTIAPVSIDNQEWVFASAYDKALSRNDNEMMQRIGSAYVTYMESVFEFFEINSSKIVGYEPKQILLIHANALNTNYLDELANMLKARGYSFITLDDAMTDPFYSMPETYTGGRGLSWLHRIASSQGVDLDSEPRDPQWLSDIYP